MTLKFENGPCEGHAETVKADDWKEVHRIALARGEVIQPGIYHLVFHTPRERIYRWDAKVTELKPGESVRVVKPPASFWNS